MAGVMIPMRSRTSLRPKKIESLMATRSIAQAIAWRKFTSSVGGSAVLKYIPDQPVPTNFASWKRSSDSTASNCADDGVIMSTSPVFRFASRTAASGMMSHCSVSR